MLHRYRLPADTDITHFIKTAAPTLEPIRELLEQWQAPTDLCVTFWTDPHDQSTLIAVDGPEDYLPAWEDLPGMEPFGWNTRDGDLVPDEVWQERGAAWQRATRHDHRREWAWPAQHMPAPDTPDQHGKYGEVVPHDDHTPAPTSTEEYMQLIADKIAKFGYTHQHVLPAEGQPPFTYTVGLTAQGFPEVIVFGLPPETAQAVLAPVVNRVRAGEELANGQLLTDVVRGYPVMVLEVTDTSELRVAHVAAGPDRGVRAWQVVFPDAEGNWPWDAGSHVAGQTVLGDPPR